MERKKFDKRAKITIYSYDKDLSIAVQKDCEKFLLEFEQLQSFAFNDFVKIWQYLNFSYIFGGQEFAVILQQFCDNCFFVIKKFIVFPKSIYTQIGAFYLLYGLYYKQPVKSWVKIRITLEEYKIIMNMLNEMKEKHVFDPLYVFSKLKTDNAFIFVATRERLGLEDRFLRTNKIYYDDTFSTLASTTSLESFKAICNETINTLEKTDNEYHAALKAYSRNNPQLIPFESKITEEFKKSCSKVFDEEGETSDLPDSILQTRRSIRLKAVKNKNAVYRAKKAGEVKSEAMDED